MYLSFHCAQVVSGSVDISLSLDLYLLQDLDGAGHLVVHDSHLSPNLAQLLLHFGGQVAHGFVLKQASSKS